MSDKQKYAPVYLRKKGDSVAYQLKQPKVESADIGISISGASYYKKEYIAIDNANSLREYLSRRGIPSNVVIGDDFRDTTPLDIYNCIEDFIVKNEVDPRHIHLKLECYELELRKDIRARFEQLCSDYEENN